MIGLELKADPAQLAEVERAVGHVKNGVPRVLVRAVNKVARGQRTNVVRIIAARTGLKQKDVRDRNVKLSSANFRRMAATIRVRGRPVPLIKLGARGPEPSRGKGRGVTVRETQVTAGGDGGRGDRVRLPRAFIATMITGHRGVFQRVLMDAPAGARGRLPIVELFGPSPVSLFAPELPVVERDTAEKLAREIQVQTELVLRKS